MSDDPYNLSPKLAANKLPAPPVFVWYVIFCLAIALLNFLPVIMGIMMLAAPLYFTQGMGRDMDQISLTIAGIFYTVVFGLMIMAYGAAPFLPKRPWVWIYGLVLILITMTSCVCLIFAIPLLIYWLKPETKAFFGR